MPSNSGEHEGWCSPLWDSAGSQRECQVLSLPASVPTLRSLVKKYLPKRPTKDDPEVK